MRSKKEIRENLANAKSNLEHLRFIGVDREERVGAIIETLEWVLETPKSCPFCKRELPK